MTLSSLSYILNFFFKIYYDFAIYYNFLSSFHSDFIFKFFYVTLRLSS